MKKVNKGAKRRLLLLFSVFLVLIIYISFMVVNYWKLILKNKKDVKELEIKYNKLLEEQEILKTDVIKLQDPEYVAKYAREKYLYTKDGELIIKIVEENK